MKTLYALKGFKFNIPATSSNPEMNMEIEGTEISVEYAVEETTAIVATYIPIIQEIKAGLKEFAEYQLKSSKENQNEIIKTNIKEIEKLAEELNNAEDEKLTLQAENHSLKAQIDLLKGGK